MISSELKQSSSSWDNITPAAQFWSQGTQEAAQLQLIHLQHESTMNPQHFLRSVLKESLLKACYNSGVSKFSSRLVSKSELHSNVVRMKCLMSFHSFPICLWLSVWLHHPYDSCHGEGNGHHFPQGDVRGLGFTERFRCGLHETVEIISVSYLHLRSFFSCLCFKDGLICKVGLALGCFQTISRLGNFSAQWSIKSVVLQHSGQSQDERGTDNSRKTTNHPIESFDFCGASLMFDLHNKNFTAINLMIHLIVLNSAQHRECWNR